MNHRIVSTFLLLVILDLGFGQRYLPCRIARGGDRHYNQKIHSVSMNWFETPSIVHSGSDCVQDDSPLGLQSYHILDQQITASSAYDKNHGPANARLNRPASLGKTGGWSAKTNNQNQWLQVDFGRNAKITKFATQGRQDYDQWVKSYTLVYSEDGANTFKSYQENDVDKVFSGNSDQNSVVNHVLSQPITARYVQIRPKSWKGHISMRAEFYGCILSDRYQVLGRRVHMDFVRRHLQKKKKVNLEDSQEWPNNIELEVLADTIYVEGDVKLHGVKMLTLFARKVVFLKEGRLNLNAPTLTQAKFKTLPPGGDGESGKHGVNGGIVFIRADILEGYTNITSNGGSGNMGQDGANGRNAPNSMSKRADKTESDCRAKAKTNYWGDVTGCSDVSGTRGEPGERGGDGGNAGRSGNGGRAGEIWLFIGTLRGKLDLAICKGPPRLEPSSGKGGEGGLGGQGGRGIKCKYIESSGRHTSNGRCESNGQTDRADSGSDGKKGRDGQDDNWFTSNEGDVSRHFLHLLYLDRSHKKNYPLVLLKLMMRYGEDLIWANKIKEGEDVLKFLVSLTDLRNDASEIKKVAKRRLSYLRKKGFDRFGRNELFAPLMNWVAFKEELDTLKTDAKAYEDAYNAIQTSVDQEDGIKKVLQALPKAAKIQVVNENKRLVEARRIAISEKTAYVLSIGQLEKSMESSLKEIVAQLPDVYEKAKFNKGDLFVMLQGLTGFASSIKGKDPIATISTAIGVAGHFATKCKTGTLQATLGKIKNWLKFGETYKALKDSSDLDFDKMDVEAVPEVMKANLEMNKEGLAADLVCMLDERSLPRNKAKFQEQIERFFIGGAARIDLIAKVIDLDNTIGGYNYDIPNLEETANEIESLGNADDDSPIANNIQQMFLDDLLTSYQQIETNFTKPLYHVYKAFEFRTLWNVEDKLWEFQRLASEAAKGTKKLQGVVQLSKALDELTTLENKGRKCFTKFPYSLNTHKWSYDSVKDEKMFRELHNGSTTFSLRISYSCETCYNYRLLKMYLELYGDNSRSGNYPGKVYLKLRQRSASFFRDGKGEIKEYRQPLGSWRTFKFNRFTITNATKCKIERLKGNRNSDFCLEDDDKRFQPMCCHYLSKSPCDDKLLGAEECRSPFGSYELSIPIDQKSPCQGSLRLTDKNCKDFDRSMFTKMNVHVHYMYWGGHYPTGPYDPRCSKFKQDPSSKSQVPLPETSLTPSFEN